VIMAVLFSVCLIASNLFDIKIFSCGSLTLTGGLLIFPISYILNDCMTEVYGYRKARFAIWLAFAMNVFVVGMAQIVRILPDSSFWEGGEHFNYIFSADLRITIASMLAFLCGSTVNSIIMSRMKARTTKGEGFGFRAVLSTLGGEALDSLVFFPIAFWHIGVKNMVILMVTQVVLKTIYEIIILPLTNYVVRWVKAIEGTDVYDRNISYNPFKIKDL